MCSKARRFNNCWGRTFIKSIAVMVLATFTVGFTIAQVTTPSTQVGSVTATEGSFLTALPQPKRNNATLAVGFHFQVSQMITVTSLGRYYPSSGSTHIINLWSSSNVANPLATATVSGSPVSGQIVYATITPVTLVPGNTYAIAIDELNAGDLWCDDWLPGSGNVGTLNSVFTNVVAAYGATGAYPSTATTVGGIYDTPAMIFTTNVPFISSGLPWTQNPITSAATGQTIVVTAPNYSTPTMYFMRPSSGASPTQWPVGSFFGPNGDFHSNAWITLAGNAGIQMPYTSIGAMLEILPDVNAGIIFQTINDDRKRYAYGVLDSLGHFRFSQQNDGAHCWGNGAKADQTLNDVCLARTAAGALEVNTGAAGTYGATKFTAGGNVLDGNGVTLVGVSQPVCSSSLAGKLWYSGHSAGVKDSVAVCAADVLNSFAWRTLY